MQVPGAYTAIQNQNQGVWKSWNFNTSLGNTGTRTYGILSEGGGQCTVSVHLGTFYKLHIPVWSLSYSSPKNLIQILGCNLFPGLPIGF